MKLHHLQNLASPITVGVAVIPVFYNHITKGRAQVRPFPHGLLSYEVVVHAVKVIRASFTLPLRSVLRMAESSAPKK